MDIGQSFENAVDTIVGFLPNLLGALVILVVGYVIARVVATVVRKLLARMELDRRLGESTARRYVDAVLPGASPTSGIGRFVFWLVFAFFVVAAIGALEIPTVTDFMNEVLAYLPNILVAILIFVVAALLSSAVSGGVKRAMGETTTGSIVASTAPALIMVIAMFMILEQLQIAPEIVRIAFAAVMFALALALALAFGLGGRDVAARLLDEADSKGRENANRVRQDVAVGRRRATDTRHAGAPPPVRPRDPQETQEVPVYGGPREPGPTSSPFSPPRQGQEPPPAPPAPPGPAG